MAFDYSSIASIALAQISDKGRNVILRYVDGGIYDANTDSFSGASNTDVTVIALIRDYNLRELLDTMILAGDKEVMLASSGLTAPQINDIIIDEHQYRILNINEIKPGDTSILYKLQIRLFAIDEVFRITETAVQRITEDGLDRILEN